MLSVRTAVHKPPKPERVVDTRPTVLITEHEVKLLTAAALAPVAPPRLMTRWIARVKTTFAARAVVDEVDRPRYVQRRYGYLESAAMARAMERL